MEAAREGLKAAGFEQHAEAPNLWLKDGTAVSEEHVKQIGIEKALTIHARHAEGLKLAQQSQS